MALSTELLDHILTFLQPDPEFLKACSESHPLLSQLVERYQFARTFRYSQFVKILCDRPHIAKYVHSLEVHVGPDSLILASILSMLTLVRVEEGQVQRYLE